MSEGFATYLSNPVVEETECRVAETRGLVIHGREVFGRLLDPVKDLYDCLYALYTVNTLCKYGPCKSTHKRTGDIVHSSVNFTPITLSFSSSIKLVI